MTKKVIMITLLLLLLIPSVIAVPKIKEPKPNTPKTPNSSKKDSITFRETALLGAGNIYLGNQQISETGILSVQDGISTGKIINGDSPISGFEIQTSLSGTIDLNTYLGTYHGTWILTGQNGAFEGTINGKVSVASISGKFVGIGMGNFEGQKIRGTFEGLVNNFQVEIIIEGTINCKTN